MLSRRLLEARRVVLFAWQRLTRGWDDSATWNLDRRFTATLGAQLIHLAETTHGWPCTGYETAEDWDRALRENGAKLLAYGTLDYAADPEAWDATHAGAVEALGWVAANLPDLWD